MSPVILYFTVLDEAICKSAPTLMPLDLEKMSIRAVSPAVASAGKITSPEIVANDVGMIKSIPLASF